MSVTWHPEAEDEMLEATRFYNQRVTGLGTDFLDAVDATIGQIANDPTRFSRVEGDIQRCRVTRFPYCVYFRCLPDTIRILVVKHHSRYQDYWKPRQ